VEADPTPTLLVDTAPLAAFLIIVALEIFIVCTSVTDEEQ
jgi:hypothetical protein